MAKSLNLTAKPLTRKALTNVIDNQNNQIASQDLTIKQLQKTIKEQKQTLIMYENSAAYDRQRMDACQAKYAQEANTHMTTRAELARLKASFDGISDAREEILIKLMKMIAKELADG